MPVLQNAPLSATLLGSGQVLAAGGFASDAAGNAVPTASATLFTLGPTLTLSLSALILNPTSVPAGSTSQGTVTLSIPAPAGGTAVSLSSSNPAVAAVPGERAPRAPRSW